MVCAFTFLSEVEPSWSSLAQSSLPVARYTRGKRTPRRFTTERGEEGTSEKVCARLSHWCDGMREVFAKWSSSKVFGDVGPGGWKSGAVGYAQVTNVVGDRER